MELVEGGALGVGARDARDDTYVELGLGVPLDISGEGFHGAPRVYGYAKYIKPETTLRLSRSDKVGIPRNDGKGCQGDGDL